MKYEVNGIHFKPYGNEIAGGDSERLYKTKNKRSAFKKAKSESIRHEWYEVEVRQFDDDGELVGHWYFKNGVLTNTMIV